MSLLLVNCLLLLLLFVFIFVFGPCFCCAVLSVNHLAGEERERERERERRLLKSCFKCHVTVSAMCLFLAVQWVGLQYVIVVFPGHILPTFFMRI